MFTGLITDIGKIESLQGGRLTLAMSYADLQHGESIAVNGVCLTLVNGATFELSPETLKATTASTWKAGQEVNLERALAVGERLGGHIVSGHVDGVAEVVEMKPAQGFTAFTLRVPKELMRFIAPKGSVALDGVSLTVNTVAEGAFTVMVIPHTLAATTLKHWKPGTKVNLEVDVLARYVLNALETGGAKR